MKIHRLRLQNYRRHRDTHIEPADGVTAVVGRNGSGKSTILEAIGFALFGAPATRTPKGLLRSSDAPPGDPVRVTLELELDGQALAIVRELRGTNLTPHATLTVDGQTLVAPGGNSNGAATQEIERLLGMDRQAFFTTIVAQQKDLARLADLPAADRKRMILRMLGVDALDRAIDQARERRKAAQERLDAQRQMLPDGKAVKARVSEARQAAEAAEAAVAPAQATADSARLALEAARQAHAEAQEQAQARQTAQHNLDVARRDVEAATKTLSAAEQRSAEVREAAEQADRWRPLAAGLDAAQQALDDAQAAAEARRRHDERAAEAKRIAEDVDAHRRKEPAPAPEPGPEPPSPQTIEGAAAVAQSRVRDLRNQLRRLQGAKDEATCPLCTQPLGDHVHARVADLEAELTRLEEEADAQAKAATEARAAHESWRQASETRERSKAARAAWKQRLDDLQTRLEATIETTPPPQVPDLDALRRARDEAQQAALALARCEATAAQAEAADEAGRRARGDLEAAHATQKRAEAELAARPVVDLAPLQQAITDADAASQAATERLHAARSAVELATREATHAERALATWKEQKAAVDAQAKELRIWEALAAGRGRGLLERFRSHLVGKIRPSINQEASRLLARFTNGRYTELILDDEYGLFLSDGGVPYTLDRFSGGESDLVHLALRIAVGRLLAQRSGAPELRFLALDEVFGSLDADRRDAVLGALHGLTGIYAQVLLITHQESMRDALDAVLEVVEDDGQARVVSHHG